ncbi:hypothetical protein MKW92_007479 [Papaver armeniacum]|nr:hypothetical protein MKW92_007479 [Papaver armeniacum]
MRVKKANAGAFTNLEALNFLRARGASTDPTSSFSYSGKMFSIEQIIEECQKCLADEEVEELVELISNLFCKDDVKGAPHEEDTEGFFDGFLLKDIDADIEL